MITIGERGDEELYSGSLTRILMWSKILNSAQQGPLRDVNNTVVDDTSLLVDWNGYVMDGSVQRLLGTRVCRTNCQSAEPGQYMSSGFMTKVIMIIHH